MFPYVFSLLRFINRIYVTDRYELLPETTPATNRPQSPLWPLPRRGSANEVGCALLRLSSTVNDEEPEGVLDACERITSEESAEETEREIHPDPFTPLDEEVGPPP